MIEELSMIYDEFKEANQKSLNHLENELLKIRAGKASPAMCLREYGQRAVKN